MDPTGATPADPDTPVRPQLSLWDTVSVIVGIVIGSTIYKTPNIIFSTVSSVWIGLAAWVLGGALSLVGAFVYAELATTYSRQGGDYVYLTRAFGSWAGFLFGWAQLAVIRCANIGMMAFVFAGVAIDLWDLDKKSNAGAYLAIGAVLTLSAINLLGVTTGKWVQNLLSAAKVLGLVAIVAAGLAWGDVAHMSEASEKRFGGFGLAMILVLLAYGGWNDSAFVAAELRHRRDIVRALIFGILAITVIYLLVNVAYIAVLGLEGVRSSDDIAADTLMRAFGKPGFTLMCLIVMVSALGAINGMIFTGSRVYATLGADHPVFGLLGHWHPRLGSPHWALLAQTAITLLMMFIASGHTVAQGYVDQMAVALGMAPIKWQQTFNNDGFSILLAATAPVFWIFFLMVGVSYFILRFRDRGIERPFSLPVPWNPVLPVVFCGTCLYMLYSSVDYGRALCVVGMLPLLAGLPLFLLSARMKSQRPA